MKSYFTMQNKLVEMVNVWAAYEQDKPDLSIRDFCIRYLSEHRDTLELSGEDSWKINRDGYLSALIGRMAKYAAFYSKKGLKSMELNNYEDVLFLIRIIHIGTPKKSELIYDLLTEFPSGIDIIKRLINLGLCEEFPDEHDRRSKRVKITEKGLSMMPAYFGVLGKVSQMATILLSADEKELLIGLLEKLEYFHHEQYMAGRNDAFETLYERVTQPRGDL
jgi:MarR family transcriptional regulator, lower aerobic nicotinate degradation pathway regulator